MIKHILFAVVLALCAGLTACNTNQKTAQQEPYRKKIYLNEQDYLDDLSKEAAAERREAKPNAESNYVFNVIPETPKNVYFFDERVQPKIPGVPSERDYKNTKRLWEKPRRYTAQQYYGDSAAPASNNSNTDSSASSYEDNSYDYD